MTTQIEAMYARSGLHVILRRGNSTPAVSLVLSMREARDMHRQVQQALRADADHMLVSVAGKSFAVPRSEIERLSSTLAHLVLGPRREPDTIRVMQTDTDRYRVIIESDSVGLVLALYCTQSAMRAVQRELGVALQREASSCLLNFHYADAEGRPVLYRACLTREHAEMLHTDLAWRVG